MSKIFLILSFVIFGCSFYNFERDPDLEESHKIINEVSQQIAKKYNVNIVGTSLGIPNGKFNCIGCAYQIKKVDSEDIVRKILVESIELFMLKVNSNEILRPLIVNYPITPDHVDVKVFVYDKQLTSDRTEKLASAFSCINNLYFNYDIEPHQPRHTREVCETYEEAKRKVFQ